ncbi:MAG TPA: adenylate/guanylate cyclase domain-containing protein, partial [Candidatus Limnocylindria bacterium]|nr:adenylate/guanylate cyclase domain-containing protein [Candidatus Limnocylindria bacterium]
MPRPDLPTGTVTFLFTDVEGSTRLLHELGAEAYGEALAEHRRVLRRAFLRYGGVEVDTQGDAFFIAFPTAEGAIRAAEEAQLALAEGPTRVRMGIHTGTPVLTGEGYVGPDVHRAARICAAGHGGQVLASAATAGLVGRDGLGDLGEHRLKDLSAPERIYQLGVGEFAPLKTLYQTNLPIPTTSFVGREHEVAEVAARLRDGARLLTLTGPGGTGKTRLALQAAAAVAESFPDGVWWVPLTPLRDPALVMPTAAGAVGASGDLAEHIADKRLLLLFDNFEQVVDAAADVGGLLARCPRLNMLVTSRELLQLPGEQAYPVPPLARDESVELFLTRARAVQPGFDGNGTIAVLCDRLDDLPLAVELAAARVRMLSPEQLLQRLGQRLDLLKGGRGVDDRQQTLRATIEWSHDLLSPDEQHLFARLSVFRGGWALEAAEAICDADLDVLQSLVDKSLVRVRDDRFWMLEIIREYAIERLDESGTAAELRTRHADYFLALAEDAYPHLTGDPKEWLDRLDAEHDNLRAALDRLDATGQGQLVQQLAGALWKFWSLRGHAAEGGRRLAAAAASDEQPTPARARVLIGLAGTSFATAYAPVKRHGEEALAIYRSTGDEAGVASALFILGAVANDRAEYDEGRRHLEQCLPLFEALHDNHYILLTIFQLAWSYDELGDAERGRAMDLELLRRARAVGNRRMEATGLDVVAGWAIDDGRADEALAMLRQALRMHREMNLPE